MKQLQPDRPRSVMFLASSLWFFYNHRLPLAIAARERGYRVSVAAPPDEYAARVEEQGIELIPLRIRRGLGGVSDLLAILEIASLIRQRRPDVLHLIAAKPVAYGGICARLLNVPAVVSAISGLGYAFTDNSRGSIQRSALLALYRLALRHPRQAVIFQNTEDRDLLLNAGVCSAEKSVLIEGSGVDSRRYRADRQDDRFRVVMGARLVGDKGVREFAEAAAIVKAHDPSVEFVLAGDVDPANPSSITRAELEAWQRTGLIRWIGWRDDMAEVLRDASLACLPSYREGLPRFLLEAGASSLPVVTTDVPGCHHVVQHGFNGLLVPPRDAQALAAAILQLKASPEECARMGANGRARVLERFDVQRIMDQTVALYDRLLPEQAA